MTHGAAKDIVERLRKQAGWHIDNQKMVTGPLLDEAADEIERLRAILQDAETALATFEAVEIEG